MNFTLALMGLSIYLLLWEKLPEWGNWFNAIIRRLPQPLAYLYEAWHCPFCFGFWIALALHALTGLMTLPALEALVLTSSISASALFWFLDALATATLIMAGKLLLNALAGPAINGYRMTEEFKRRFVVQTDEL